MHILSFVQPLHVQGCQADIIPSAASSAFTAINTDTSTAERASDTIEVKTAGQNGEAGDEDGDMDDTIEVQTF